MFRGGGEAGGGKKKGQVSFIKSTPKFIERLKMGIVQKEKDEEDEKLAKKRRKYEEEEGFNKFEHEENSEKIKENEKIELNEKKEQNINEKIEKDIKNIYPRHKAKDITGIKRKNLDEYTSKYEEDPTKGRKKVQTNLLSFTE